MKRFSLLVLTCLCSVVVMAQNGLSKPKVMIVPYAMNMYLSDLDDDLVRISGYTPLQVKRQTRMGAEKSIYLAGANKFEIITLANDMDDTTKQFLDGIHKSISYDYKLIPLPEEPEDQPGSKPSVQKTLGKLKGFANKVKTEVTKDDVKSSAEINDGQLVVNTSRDERFMSTTVLNPTLFEQMNAKVGTQDYYVFINQLDLNRVQVKHPETGANELMLKAKLHYSLFNTSGELIEEGAAISYDRAKVDLKDGYYNIMFPSISHDFELIFDKLQPTTTRL